MHVYGCKISYYTGKVETYLRFRSIPYDYSPTVGNERKLIEGAGVVQMPVVQHTDGRWMTDSTPILAALEAEQDQPTIYPDDPALRFAALLIDDYADEWLWRPAMHYRWSYTASRRYAAHSLYEDLIKGTRRLPAVLARRFLTRRQLGNFVRGDGVTEQTWDHVEGAYFNALDLLQAIFEKRPFILGKTPTIADFGMMAPMLRHFSQDPTPAEIMRTRAPAVYEWVARMWNTKAQPGDLGIISEIDGPLAALLAEASETHLAQLRQNADAVTQGLARYDQTIQGCDYKQVPSSRYRVWCLEELRREWTELPADAQENLKRILPSEASILWAEASFAPSNYDPERQAPFNKAINVFGKGLPPS